MADFEHDLHHQKPGGDSGRARKRKIKRESGTGDASLVERSTSNRRAARNHGTSRNRPSNRERLVADQIKDQVDSSPSIQGKLSSILGLGSQTAKPVSAARRTRRDTESRRSEPLLNATPRAETQRITNPDQGYLPPKSRRIYDAHSDAAPPVMVRGGMGGMAFGRVANSRMHKQRAPKRRIDVPLRVTGAEVRLPSLPFPQLGWRGVSLMMVLMMSACLVLMWKAPIFQVSTVEARGLKRLAVSDLNAVMGTFGKSIFSLNPTILRANLSQAFPEFSKISVRVSLPARVRVMVTERQPVIAWTQDGVETWVDAEGVSFPPRGVPEAPLVQVEGYGTPPSITLETSWQDLQGVTSGVPMLQTPNNPSLKLSPELVSSILALGAKMPVDTLLVYDSEHGLGWNDPLGWEVFFGPEDNDMEMKLIVYQALVERLKGEGIQPALISVEYVHAPYYRMER